MWYIEKKVKWFDYRWYQTWLGWSGWVNLRISMVIKWLSSLKNINGDFGLKWSVWDVVKCFRIWLGWSALFFLIALGLTFGALFILWPHWILLMWLGFNLLSFLSNWLIVLLRQQWEQSTKCGKIKWVVNLGMALFIIGEEKKNG